VGPVGSGKIESLSNFTTSDVTTPKTTSGAPDRRVRTPTPDLDALVQKQRVRAELARTATRERAAQTQVST
jgi:hypothetical protein